MSDAIHAFYGELNGSYSVRERDAAFKACGVTLDEVHIEVDADAYSDMFKEVHHFRPAGQDMRGFRLLPESFRRAIIQDLVDRIDAMSVEDAKRGPVRCEACGEADDTRGQHGRGACEPYWK
jgi:hypothetical protein